MMAQALTTGKLADPEFVQMVTEKALAANEAYWHAARHLVRAEAYDLSRAASGSLALAEACLRPYRRKVRANARRLGNRG